MKRSSTWIILILALLLAVAAFALWSWPDHKSPADVLYQVSTKSALSGGSFGGVISAYELKQHGDFGVGTFEGLDGEMIVVNGSIYHATYDGKVSLAGDDASIPFAEVTYFKADQTVLVNVSNGKATLNSPYNNTQLVSVLNTYIPQNGTFYAIRIDGNFSYMKIRAAPGEKPPYTSLADALKNESVFELHDVSGTLVGIYSPGYSDGIGFPGYHFHFISDDRAHGGHVYEFTANGADVQLDKLSGLYVELKDA
ncbi:MAG TPA: acetolactate decarboxylase [Methanocellaceae archaeon]